jgi:hypothetical protein
MSEAGYRKETPGEIANREATLSVTGGAELATRPLRPEDG